MAKEGTLGIKLNETHQPVRWQNLLFILQAMWSIILILSGSFEALTELTSLAMLVTASLSMIALFVLRKKTPNKGLLFQFRGFKLAPWSFLTVNTAILGISIYNAVLKTQEQTEDTWKAWYGLLGLMIFILLGLT